ncbi:MAG: hypothetical protein EU536_01995 [Promethearchaeota archaeon]|nr:MAG: hypothetical protein EU536_01995 [Candidatus Lokiarchaeota archaeon]
MSVRNIVNDVLKRPTVFRDETKLSIDYTPLELPHREEVIRKLAQLFKTLIENPGGATKKVVITGPSGTGKTAVTKRFGSMIQDFANERGINLHYIHINCRRYKTSFMILIRIIQHFNPNFPKRGFNVAELFHILADEILEKEEAYVLLCLDDADLLLLNDPALIYDLTRMRDDSLNSKQRLSFITVAKNNLFKIKLDASISSTFQCSTIHLEKYSNLQLIDILKDRIKETFFDGTVLNQTINLIADFAAEFGDARYALELLWLAGKHADDAKSLQITPEFARQAKGDLDPGIKKEIIRDLNLHQKLILLAITRQLKSTEKAYVIMGDCQRAYQIICEEHGITHRSYTKVWEHVKELADYSDFLSTKVAKLDNKPGQTTLLRLNVPIEILEQVLEDELTQKG